jgi:hypothetical protein
MNKKTYPLYIGETVHVFPEREVEGEFVEMLGDVFYRIMNFYTLEPFFMSIVSGSNHWLYIASTGGLSAGRVNADQALFPY